MKEILVKHGVDERTAEKAFHKFLKAYGKRKVAESSRGDQYAVSLSEKPRRICDRNDYDSYYEYGIYELDEEQEQMTDAELGKEIYECFRIPFQYEAWDCTGKPFTEYINWHRNPCGYVSIVHCIGIDV